MGFGPYRRRHVLGRPVVIRLVGYRQEENRCRELPAHDRRRCPLGRFGYGGSRNGSWQAGQIRFVLEARRPADDLEKAPFGFLVKIEHEQHN